MGSVVRSAAFPVSTRKELLAKFAKLPYNVLWKFEKKMEEELPPNVFVRTWLPQISLLGKIMHYVAITTLRKRLSLVTLKTSNLQNNF